MWRWKVLSHFRQSVNKVGLNTTTKGQHVTVLSLNVTFLIISWSKRRYPTCRKCFCASAVSLSLSQACWRHILVTEETIDSILICRRKDLGRCLFVVKAAQGQEVTQETTTTNVAFGHKSSSSSFTF